MRTSGVVLLMMLGAQTAMARPGELTVEARVGPYVPDVEVSKGYNALDIQNGQNAFNCAFGFGVRPILFASPQLSVFDLFGTALVGVEGGFYSVRGRQLTNPSDCNSAQGLNTNELAVVPLMLTGTYRFDWALDKFGIPLVPYARVGIGGAGYLLTNNGQFSRANVYDNLVGGKRVTGRRDPLGFSFGGKVAVGMMLALDVLEPLRALRARAKGVYKHTYIFTEVAAFDAGWLQNELIAASPSQVKSYFGPALIVGSERLPMLTAGLAVAF